MSRPPKLTQSQKEEIVRRLIRGDRPADLAREYSVSKSLISSLFSKRTETLRSVARQVVDVEIAFGSLTVSEQATVRSLADDLKDISVHMASAAKYGAMTAHRLAQMAHCKTDEIDPLRSADANADAIRSVVVLTETANKSAHIGLNLLAANKDAVKDKSGLTLEQLVTASQGDKA